MLYAKQIIIRDLLLYVLIKYVKYFLFVCIINHTLSVPIQMHAINCLNVNEKHFSDI